MVRLITTQSYRDDAKVADKQDWFDVGVGLAAQYNPRTGEYMGADGQLYRQADMAASANAARTWKDLMPT